MRPLCGGGSGLSKILICAGGTGGGIYPALAVAHELEALGLSYDDLLWIGTQGEMEEELVPRAGIRLETISGGAIVGVPLRVKVMNGLKLLKSIGTAYRLLGQFRPDAMLMTGGYMAVPVALAARLRRVPIVIYLPDVEPGSAIKALMPLAHKVAVDDAWVGCLYAGPSDGGDRVSGARRTAPGVVFEPPGSIGSI
jgi:UDP-N-acetylglucosamine--N-acetylmuramyl-(pentapeptide) pyrophosphoryl-undecaprenol N-acetylglucosamine transferase